MPNRNFGISTTSEEIRDLRLLEELGRNPVTSQRELSHKLNIALGVTNACLRRMALKGWIRMRGLSHRKIGYYLTPKGFSEKAKLTLNKISWTVQHYAELKKIVSQRLSEMEHAGMRRIVFYGVSDEMEVAYITLQGINLKLVGIVEDDERFTPQRIFGYELERVHRIHELEPDCILITSLEGSEKKMERLGTLVAGRKVLIRDLCAG